MSDVEILELSTKQAAGFVGVSARQFLNYLKGPYPPPRLGNKKFRSDHLGEWLIARAIRENTVVGDGEERIDPQQALARKNAELADKAALENQVRRGELIEASDVEGAWTDILARVRSRMLRVPSASAPLVLGVDDLVEVQSVIDTAVRDALSEMSADWREDAVDE